jgi:VIT1/CCC1 family predicted Fe2+/Mn2+ transporter
MEGEMDDKNQVSLANYQDEINSAYLYEALSKLEKNEQLSEVYRKMSESEIKHAQFWKTRLEDAGIHVEPKPDTRSRMLRWIAATFGIQTILPILIGGEKNASDAYNDKTDPQLMEMAGEEESHERLMRQMVSGTRGGMEGGTVAQMEGRHKASGGNALRAAVLGANDGLVSNLSLVMGVAGAELAGRSILITGLAGLLAGAASMALGEWLSVQSSRELYQHQIDIERAEIENAPEEEAEELSLIYQAKGLSEEQANHLTEKIMADKNTTVDTLAREELGINPEELGGSAWEAAITSFFLFAVGAIIPVSPFIFWTGTHAIILSLIFSAVGLFVIGALITLMTGKNFFQSGFRQVVFGLVAAGLTFGIGKLIGVSIGG